MTSAAQEWCDCRSMPADCARLAASRKGTPDAISRCRVLARSSTTRFQQITTAQLADVGRARYDLAVPPLTTDMQRGELRPYFLWDEDVSIDELRAILGGPDSPRREQLLGKMLPVRTPIYDASGCLPRSRVYVGS